MQDTERGAPVEFLDPASEQKQQESPDDRLLRMLDWMEDGNDYEVAQSFFRNTDIMLASFMERHLLDLPDGAEGNMKSYLAQLESMSSMIQSTPRSEAQRSGVPTQLTINGAPTCDRLVWKAALGQHCIAKYTDPNF